MLCTIKAEIAKVHAGSRAQLCAKSQENFVHSQAFRLRHLSCHTKAKGRSLGPNTHHVVQAAVHRNPKSLNPNPENGNPKA